MTATFDTPSSISGLTSAQRAALEANTSDGSDRVALVAVLPGEPDLRALTQALMELRRRHEVLRTTIRATDDGPVAIVGARTVVPVELIAKPAPHPADGFPPKHFDLLNGPLLRAAIFPDAVGRTLLGIQAHPVVLDEEAMRRGVHELGLLYRYFRGVGPIPPATQIAYREHAAMMPSASGRVPRRISAVTHEIDSDTADRISLIASSRGLPVALLVLAAWIAATAATSGAPAAPVAASLPDPSGTQPLGPTCDRVLLRADPGSRYDIVALAERLRSATVDAEPDDGGTPITFTFHDDRHGVRSSPLEIVETGSMLAPSEVSLTTHGTPTAGWRLRLTHRSDIAGSTTVHPALARTAALLENAGASLVDEELL
jgi:hypothetical protein